VEEGVNLVLEAKENYWKGAPAIQTIVFRPIKEAWGFPPWPSTTWRRISVKGSFVAASVTPIQSKKQEASDKLNGIAIESLTD
jgi:hypothetical protein